jgi:hypothetical protein
LKDAENNQILIDQSITNDGILMEDWYPLRFNPDWGSAGKQYILTIQGINAATGQGFKILYTTQSQFDFGNLHQNGQPVQEDIVLQYGCVAGLRKIWLTGKP